MIENDPQKFMDRQGTDLDGRNDDIFGLGSEKSLGQSMVHESPRLFATALSYQMEPNLASHGEKKGSPHIFEAESPGLLTARHRRVQRRLLQPNKPPRVTVALVTLNALERIRRTVMSICLQDYDDFEFIVVDGGSTDGTREFLASIAHLMDRYVAEPDDGPYSAMNKAATYAQGDFIIFMNAGDWFYDMHTLSEAAYRFEDHSDVIFGHHIYVGADNKLILRKAQDFGYTWSKLTQGDIDHEWLSSIPCHQSTFTRVELLRRLPYDESFRIAADHDFLYRLAAQKSKFQIIDMTIGIYTHGGISSLDGDLCCHEWWKITRKFGPKESIDSFFYYQISPCIDIHPSLRGSMINEIATSGLFFEAWYRNQYLMPNLKHVSAIEHYIGIGNKLFLKPNPFFDPEYYCNQKKDIISSGMNPLIHYIRIGHKEVIPTIDWKCEANTLGFFQNYFNYCLESIYVLIDRLCDISYDDIVRDWRRTLK